MKHPPSVFISHSMSDAGTADEIRRSLMARGFDVWSDATIRFGESWQEQIETAITNADVFVLVVSPEFLQSRYALFELGIAYSRAREGTAVIIPVVVRDAQVPAFLQQFLQTRLLSPSGVSDVVTSAIKGKDQ